MKKISIVLVLILLFTTGCSFLDSLNGEDPTPDPNPIVDPDPTPDPNPNPGPTPEPHVHTWSDEWTITEDYHYHAPLCDDTDELKDLSLHLFGDWQIIAEATEDTDGLKQRVCSVCGYTEIETIPALTHEHSFADTYSYNPMYHYYAASCSHNVKKDQELHTFESIYDNGKYTVTCSVCGYQKEYIDDFDINYNYGYNNFLSLERNGFARLYKQMYDDTVNFYNSNQEVEADGDLYYINKYDFNALGLTSDEAISVWSIFYLENPKFYFLDSTVYTRGNEISLGISEEYASSTRRSVINNKLINETNNFLKGFLGSTNLEKAVYIHDYLCKKIDYAYKDNGKPETEAWAHSIVGLLEHDKGVCECYSKMSIYLCKLLGLKNIAVSGVSYDENHMWNLIKINNEYYAFDFTWDDSNGNDFYYNVFGVSGEMIEVDHTPRTSDVFNSNYLYDLPQLSTRDIELVKVYEDGLFIGYKKNLDDCFLGLDSDKEYEFKLVNAFAKESGNNANMLGVYSITTPLPLAKITITGNVFEGASSSVIIPYVEFATLTNELNNDLIFRNVSLKCDTCTLDLKGNNLIFNDYYSDVSLRIKDTRSGSIKIDLDPKYGSAQIKLRLECDINKLDVKSGQVQLENLNANQIHIKDVDLTTSLIIVNSVNGSDIDIDNINLLTKNPVLQIINTNYKDCKINIDDVSENDNHYLIFNVRVSDYSNYPNLSIRNTHTLLQLIVIDEGGKPLDYDKKVLVNNTINMVSTKKLYFYFKFDNTSEPAYSYTNKLSYAGGKIIYNA